jgi:hypothetical protein
MSRRLPTKGSIEFFRRYLDTLVSKMSSNLPDQNKESIRNHLRKIQSIHSDLVALEILGMASEIPEKRILSEDSSTHMPIAQGWDRLIAEDTVDLFGRYGIDAISCLGEAIIYTNALATVFGANKVFYRGEQQYGWSLISRAERNMDFTQSYDTGLSDREAEEIKRFQDMVKSDKEIAEEIFHGDVPGDNSPRWLPIMQHYDTEFGTRLLDLTSSVFTGLYFACVSWDGCINEDMDGLLYVFFDKSSQWRGEYIFSNNGRLTEFDDVIPENLFDSFQNWKYPEYFRLYRSQSSSPREMAQDGVFLVRGILGGERNHGQNFKFRIPAEQKKRIAKELWFAGYTPARIVRGQIGVDAEKELSKILGLRI